MNIKRTKQKIIDNFIKTGVKDIADLGAGDGINSAYLSDNGCNVTAIDINFQSNMISPEKYKQIIANIDNLEHLDKSFDGILASHCLEHMFDPFGTLLKWRSIIKNNGYLCVIVPPFVHRVVDRHLFVGWNIGHLMLLLLRTGFNIKDGRFISEDYNIAAIVSKSENLINFSDNDEILTQYSHMFPAQISKAIKANVINNAWNEKISFFDGNIKQINWN